MRGAKAGASKRIEGLVAEYQKPLLGVLAALEIGLESIRVACPLFNQWLVKLELEANGIRSDS